MDHVDLDKVDEAALAPLFLTLGDDGRAWKGVDWAVTDRIHAMGLIDDPKNKSRSVWLTPEGRAEAERLFHTLFARAR